MGPVYLVQYGRSAFVGRFCCDSNSGSGTRQSSVGSPATSATCNYARGDRVVIRGPRGVEIGAVLCEIADRFAATPDDGELLRTAAPNDFDTSDEREAQGQSLLTAAEAAGLPIAFIDCEVSLDGSLAVLHGLPWGECDASPVFAELGEQFGLAVRFLDLSRTPTPTDPQQHGCGKPGCGSESGGCTSCGTGGGCSTGSCSKGAVKSAEELTAYFADLRKQMEAQSHARTPLV